MRPAWAQDYLQLPFLERGRSREGLDCYGLVRLVFADRLGITLPSYAEDYATTTDSEAITALMRGEVASSWQVVGLAQAGCFDVAILRILGEPIHCALVLDPPYFLHTMRGAWSTIERWDSLLWQKRLLEIVRWRGGECTPC